MFKKIGFVFLSFALAIKVAQAEDVRIFYSGDKVSRGTTLAKVGDRVTIYNESRTPHFFESKQPGFEFKTPMLQYKQSYTIVFFKSGITTIVCPDHPDAKMRLVIQGKTRD